MEEMTLPVYKVYVKTDVHGCIISVEGTAFHTEEELTGKGYVYVDEGTDGNIYAHCQPNYLKSKHGKPMYDESGCPNFKLNENTVQELSEEETVTELSEEEKEEYFIKPAQKAQAVQAQNVLLEQMMVEAQKTSFLVELPDSEAVKIPYCYDSWDSYIGKPLTKLNEQGKENRIEYNGELWKVRNDIPVVLENQAPGIETAALYERIDEQHAGTLEDPIPYANTMTVYNGKYYIEEGIIYKCIRDSGQPLYATCASLVGNYFEVA